MYRDNHISDNNLEAIQEEYAQKTCRFLEIREEIRESFDWFGVKYPYSAENNYRDSWFHYRKIYKEHGMKALLGQMAMFDEHLQRAEKDDVVLFWTRISQRLEFWYNMYDRYEMAWIDWEDVKTILETGIDPEHCTETIMEEAYRLYKESSNNANKLFAVGCMVYVHKQGMVSEKFRRDVQRLFHKVKNIILRVRHGGTDIIRHDNIGDYLEQFRECEADLAKLCKNYHFLGLLNATDRIDAWIAEL